MAFILNMAGARFSYSPSPVDGLATHYCRHGDGIGRGGSVKPIFSPAPLYTSSRRSMVVRAEAINPEIRKSEEKVVDSVIVSELSKPLTAYCRCWRSGTFPLCDGSHVKHNKATGDNVGPLLLKKQ